MLQKTKRKQCRFGKEKMRLFFCSVNKQSVQCTGCFFVPQTGIGSGKSILHQLQAPIEFIQIERIQV